MSGYRLVRKEHLAFIAVISTLVITSPSISTYGYFDVTKVVYGQPAPDQTNSNTTNSVNLQDIPLDTSMLFSFLKFDKLLFIFNLAHVTYSSILLDHSNAFLVRIDLSHISYRL